MRTILAIGALLIALPAAQAASAGYQETVIIPTPPERVFVPKGTPVCPTGHDAMVSLGEGRVVFPCIPNALDATGTMTGRDQATNSVWVNLGYAIACDHPQCPTIKGFVFAGNAHESNQPLDPQRYMYEKCWNEYDPMFPRGFAGQPPLACQHR